MVGTSPRIQLCDTVGYFGPHGMTVVAYHCIYGINITNSYGFSNLNMSSLWPHLWWCMQHSQWPPTGTGFTNISTSSSSL